MILNEEITGKITYVCIILKVWFKVLFYFIEWLADAQLTSSGYVLSRRNGRKNRLKPYPRQNFSKIDNSIGWLVIKILSYRHKKKP